MSEIYKESLPVDWINAVCEQLAGFIMKEILNPRGEFYHDGHINIGSPAGSSVWRKTLMTSS